MMKKIFSLLTLIFVFLFLLSCSDDSLKEDFSPDTALSTIKFVDVAEGVKINFSKKIITLAIRRDCPKTVTLDANLPFGAKIIEVSEGLELKSDTTVGVNLNVSEQFFVIQAQDIKVIEKYVVDIVSDKADLALHLIEQTFQQDGSFVWKHERNDSEMIVSSRLVNVDNDKNFKTFLHETNASGLIIGTSYTTNMHKHYTYVWKYDNGNLVSYDKQLFNGLLSHHFIIHNENNLIVKLIKKNDFDYVLDKIDFTYDEKNRIVKKTGVSLIHDQVYTYDDKNRIISFGDKEYTYDDFGNIVKETSTVASSMANYERTYNVDGSLATEKALKTDGSVRVEYGFSYFDNGRIAKEERVGGMVSYIYNEDGSYKSTLLFDYSGTSLSSYDIYDVNHNKIKYFNDQTDSRASLSYKEERNYEYNENSLISKQTSVRDDKDGEPVVTKVTNYEYNDTHLLVKSTTTINGQLDYVNKIKYDANGLVTERAFYNAYNIKYMTYVYTFYNYGKTQSSYSESSMTGIAIETTYDYFANWNLNKVTEKSTIYGELKSECICEYYQDGFTKQKYEKKDYENGSLVRRTVDEFNVDGMRISTIVYDGEGNIIDN